MCLGISGPVLFLNLPLPALISQDGFPKLLYFLRPLCLPFPSKTTSNCDSTHNICKELLLTSVHNNCCLTMQAGCLNGAQRPCSVFFNTPWYIATYFVEHSFPDFTFLTTVKHEVDAVQGHRVCPRRQRAKWSMHASPSTSGRMSVQASAADNAAQILPASAVQIKPAYLKYKCACTACG